MKTKWFKSLFYFGLTFFSLLILASTALTATIIVPDDYSTIQAAINAATYGDTVYVRAGTYSPSTNGEVFPINMRNGVSLVGEGADSCVLDAEMTNCVIYCDGITDATTIIEGFSITNGGIFYDGEPGSGGGIVCWNGSSPTIAHNSLTGNSAEWGGGITCGSGSSPTITNNTIAGNHPFAGAGIWCQESTSNPTITNNLIYENSGTYFGGIICWGGGSPTITNNTVSGNIAEYGGGVLASGLGTIITNNIITGNIASEMGGGLGGEPGSGTIITYNNVWGNSPIDYYDCAPGVGCISANPLFVDLAGGDYHLQSSSPCIDIGDNSALGLPGIDFDGDNRKIDGDRNGSVIVDMGIDEYDPSPVLDLTANGSDGPITIAEGDPLEILLSLDAVDYAGEDADWWVLMKTSDPKPNNWYYFDMPTRSWMPGRSPTRQGSLFDISSKKIPKTSGLAPGTYTFYFAVDMDMNGAIDVGLAFYDKVKVTINP